MEVMDRHKALKVLPCIIDVHPSFIAIVTPLTHQYLQVILPSLIFSKYTLERHIREEQDIIEKNLPHALAMPS
jgi:hypothetical protein